MPFNGSGLFTRTMNWVNDAAANIKIRADRHDSNDDDLAAGLSMALLKDGQQAPIANIPFNAKRIVNLGDPVNPQDAVTMAWVGANVVGGALIADAPPAAGKVGNLWWDSDQGNLYLRYDDGTSTQWVQVNVASPAVFDGGAFKRTVYTASTNAFQFDETTAYADIECVGGGGGGGGTSGASSAGASRAGGGGGGGGYIKRLIPITAANRAAMKTIVVGTGGGGGSPTGGTGGNSSYDDGTFTLIANGGAGGVGGSVGTNANTGNGGTGGLGSGGILIAGQAGQHGMSFGQTNCGAGNSSGTAGHGGSSGIGGGGGVGGFVNATTGAANSSGGSGVTYGGGGGGGIMANAAGSNTSGGPGYQGIVIITEYR